MPLKLIEPGKRKGNRYYLVRGTFDGKPVELSTKETTRRAAVRCSAPFPCIAAISSRAARQLPRGGEGAFPGSALNPGILSTALTVCRYTP